MYPRFLDMGYTPLLFWESSLEEIRNLFGSYERRMKNELRNQIYVMNGQSAQIQDIMIGLFDEKHTARTLDALYPELFEVRQVDKKEEIKNYKADFDDFIFRHNRRMKEGGE